MAIHRIFRIMAGGCVLALTVSLPAYAANVFMLQFGSYQSADEAQSHLNELQNKHPGALSRLPLSVRPVSLPPDNMTVYRTQAGPLATRADAQAVCSQLASNGDECYVVESAMSAATANSNIAASAPASDIASTASSSVAVPSVAVAAPSVSASKAAASDIPVVPSLALAPAAATTDTSSSPPPSISASMASPEVSTAQASAAEDSVRKALDDAAQNQQKAEMDDQNPPPPKKKPDSFWDHLNPFSENTNNADTTNSGDITSPSAARAAAVESVQSQPIAPPAAPAVIVPPAPAPEATIAADTSVAAPSKTVQSADDVMLPPPVIVKPVPTPAPVVVMAPPVVVTPPAPSAPPPAPLGNIPPPSAPAPAIATAPAPIPNFPLPPPPAPLHSSSAASSIATAGTIQPATPVMETPLPAPGNVHVEEARRVPTAPASGVAPVPVAPAAPANPAFAQIPGVDLSPSATTGQRTLWAEIGPFASAQAALAYWSNYRQLHPDFPVVRVRVTTPLSSQQRGISESNLRVGPFARPEFIRTLCSSLPGTDSMKCGSVADLGIAVNPYSNRPGYLGQSRYSH